MGPFGFGGKIFRLVVSQIAAAMAWEAGASFGTRAGEALASKLFPREEEPEEIILISSPKPKSKRKTEKKTAKKSKTNSLKRPARRRG